MKLQKFDTNLDIALKANINYKNSELSGKPICESVATLLPASEKNLNTLYKLTGKHYNQILKTFISAFLYIDNVNEKLYELIFDYRRVMIPHNENISFYVANYLLSSTQLEVSYFNDGIQILNEYFAWSNKNKNCKVLKELTKTDLDFIHHCGDKLFDSFPTQCCVALPQQYIMHGGDARIKDLTQLLGKDKVEKFKKSLQEISIACDKCAEVKNLKTPIPKNQQTLDKFMH